MSLKVIKLSPWATCPTRGFEEAAGLDLYSAYDYVVKCFDRILVKTDIQVQFPPNTYGRIAPRSGLALACGINVGGGVIDPDYTGGLGVILFNHSKDDFRILRGDRIAQLICEQFVNVTVEEVSVVEPTKRGDGGFGSTGMS